MFKLIQKSNPGQYYETRKADFLVGKSKQCEIVIGDPHISDVQAKVKAQNNRYFIKNLGQSPIAVNGQKTAGKFLNSGDEIAMGKTKFLIQLSKEDNQSPQPISMEAKTLVLDSPKEEMVGPRLVCTSPSGKSRLIPLNI
jgi:predicted component of type VI protein secretion system